jgi:hypothetical protein
MNKLELGPNTEKMNKKEKKQELRDEIDKWEGVSLNPTKSEYLLTITLGNHEHRIKITDKGYKLISTTHEIFHWARDLIKWLKIKDYIPKKKGEKMTESKLNTKEWVNNTLNDLIAATIKNIYNIYGFISIGNAKLYDPGRDLIDATQKSINYILFNGIDKVTNIEAKKFLRSLQIDESNHVVLDKVDDKLETFIEVFIREVI